MFTAFIRPSELKILSMIKYHVETNFCIPPPPRHTQYYSCHLPVAVKLLPKILFYQYCRPRSKHILKRNWLWFLSFETTTTMVFKQKLALTCFSIMYVDILGITGTLLQPSQSTSVLVHCQLLHEKNCLAILVWIVLPVPLLVRRSTRKWRNFKTMKMMRLYFNRTFFPDTFGSW